MKEKNPLIEEILLSEMISNLFLMKFITEPMILWYLGIEIAKEG